MAINKTKKRSASRHFFENAQSKFRANGLLEEENQVLPSVDDDEIELTDDNQEDELQDKAEARRKARIRKRRSRIRTRLGARLEDDDEDEVPIDKDIELTEDDEDIELSVDDEDEDVELTEDDEDIELTDEDDDDAMSDGAKARLRARLKAAIKTRLARNRKSRIKTRTRTGRRFKNGFDTEQLGENIANSVDYTVIKTKLAKVKMNKLSSMSQNGSSISRVNKTGKFRLSDGRGNKVAGTLKFRANGTVKSFRITK